MTRPVGVIIAIKKRWNNLCGHRIVLFYVCVIQCWIEESIFQDLNIKQILVKVCWHKQRMSEVELQLHAFSSELFYGPMSQIWENFVFLCFCPPIICNVKSALIVTFEVLVSFFLVGFLITEVSNIKYGCLDLSPKGSVQTILLEMLKTMKRFRKINVHYTCRANFNDFSINSSFLLAFVFSSSGWISLFQLPCKVISILENRSTNWIT